MSRAGRLNNILILAFLLASVFGLLLVDLGPSDSQLLHDLLDYGHVLLFGVVSLVFLWLHSGRVWPVRRLLPYAASFLFASALGAFTEFLQVASPDRDAGVGDILRDMLGSLCFLVLAYPFPGPAAVRARVFKAVAVLALVLATAPVQLSLLETWRMGNDFPLINSFEHWWETSSWGATTASFTRSGEHATHGSHTLETHLEPGRYPGIALERFNHDWSGFKTFSFDVFLDGDRPLNVLVRVNDARHTWRFRDRFNRTYTLAPGANRISIDLGEVRKAPSGRLMDMQEITDVVIFSYKLKEPRTLFFDNFRLWR